MKNPWTLASDRILISKPEYEWECQWISVDGNKTGYPIHVNEAPQFFRSKNKDKLLIYYSASGNWTPYYCVGLLTADANSDLLNPNSWKKSLEPVFKQAPENHVYGPGSLCFIPSPDKKEWYILYHARNALRDMFVLDGRTTRIQKIEWDENGIPILGIPQKESTLLQKPSGTPTSDRN
jgi:GH43 family beta-xylosidase